MEREQALNTIVHALLEERTLVDDPNWDTVAVLVSLAPSVSEMTAYRYAGDGPGTPTPLVDLGFQPFRDLQEATAAPDGSLWEICIIKVERDSRRGAVNFVYGDAAEMWKITPGNAERIAENLRPRPADFVS